MLGLIIFLLCLAINILISLVGYKKDWNNYKTLCWIIMADVAVCIITFLVYAWFIIR